MSKSLFSVGVFVLTFAACAPNSKDRMNTTTKISKPPIAKIDPHIMVMHGDTRVDNYYWLNERENPEVINYLKAENSYADEVLADVKGLQDTLYEEIVGRIKQTDMSVPYNYNGYTYYTRYEEGLQYPIYCRKKLDSDSEEILLDVNQLAEGYEFFNTGSLQTSPDNKLLVYGEDTVSRRIYTLKVKDLTSGQYLPDEISGTTGYAVWADDNKTLFYTAKDPVTLRAYKIYRHTLGTPQAEDVLVFEEKDDTFGAYVTKTKSEKYLLIHSSSTLSDEARFIPAARPASTPVLIQKRQKGLEYRVDHYGSDFYILTNRDAKNFKVVKTSVAKPGVENWTDVVAARPDVRVEGIELFKDYMVVEERKNGLTTLRVMPWSGGREHYVPFPDSAYSAWVSVNPEFDTPVLRYGYTSMVVPGSVYDYNMETGEQVLLKRSEVVGGYDPEQYESERIFATAVDGTKIPISLVYKKGTAKDGTAPLLLYGYGSYGASMDPYFSSTRLSLLDRGFVFALAHIRGGEEMGREWYEGGKMLNKKNTFTDFIACGKHLVAEGYAAPDRLYAMGGSAGGLLMGAVVNMEPQMWNGVVAQVPFVDVLTTMLDESIPLTTGEYDEWGNPNDKVYYDYIKSYSPYDNLKETAYPAMLVTTGLHDSQVQYWEPAKWVAKLRTVNTGSEPLLLVTNMEAGHGGASGRFEQYREVALEYAFLLRCEQQKNRLKK